jgi:CBS domain containing-hemolysin-like protein
MRSRSVVKKSWLQGWAIAAALLALPAQASLFKGEALDAAADVISWVVIVLVPIIGIVVFWLVHILPEKIAEKKKHPQAKAIQVLCLLSLVFGGMLWPIAWLWAYSKPVLYKMAYGTDEVEHEHGAPTENKAQSGGAEPAGEGHG